MAKTRATNNHLESKISYFKNAFTETPTSELTIQTYMENVISGYWMKQIKEVRANKDSSKYKTLKSKLPGVTISGHFRSRNKNIPTEQRLISHSGFICIDVDRKDNLKSDFSKVVDEECFAQFLSVSGDGIKIIYRCEKTDSANVHRRIYDAVAERLQKKKVSLKIDPVVKSIANLQYITADPKAYYNPKTNLVIKALPPIQRVSKKPKENVQDLVEQLNEYIEALGTKDITKSYENWLLIAFGLSYSLGEEGRDIFHRLSANYDGYSQAECDEKYDACLDRDYEHIPNPVTVATVFQLINDAIPKVKLKQLNKKYNASHSIGIGEDGQENGDLAGMVKYKLFLFKKRIDKHSNSVEDLIPYSINLNEFEALLKRLGFFRYQNDYVHINNNIVEEVDGDDVLRIVTRHIEDEGDYNFTYRGIEYHFSWEELVHLWRGIRANGTTYNQVSTSLNRWEPNLIQDTADTSFIPYRNGVVKVTNNKIELLPYDKIDKQIWKERILDRDFVYTKDKGMFEKFFVNVCGRGKNDKAKLASEQYFRNLWFFGYMLQGTKRYSTARAWVLYDLRVGNNGRSGKSIIGQAVGKVRNVVTLDGKRIDFQNRFAFQTVKPWTDVVFIDDPSKYMSLNPLFNMITGQLDADVKNSDPIVKSVKFMIASNWILENEGTSEAGRQFVTQLDDFYVRYAKENNTITPIVDLHGKEFFTDWDEKDWIQFDSFCVRALQHHLKEKPPEGVVINDAKVMRFIQVHEEEMYAELCSTLKKHHRVLKDGTVAVPQFIMVEVVKQFNAEVKGQRAGRIIRDFLNAIGCAEVGITSIQAPSGGGKMAYKWNGKLENLTLHQS
jgi:hypothetical protein